MVQSPIGLLGIKCILNSIYCIMDNFINVLLLHSITIDKELYETFCNGPKPRICNTCGYNKKTNIDNDKKIRLFGGNNILKIIRKL